MEFNDKYFHIDGKEFDYSQLKNNDILETVFIFCGKIIYLTDIHKKPQAGHVVNRIPLDNITDISKLIPSGLEPDKTYEITFEMIVLSGKLFVNNVVSIEIVNCDDRDKSKIIGIIDVDIIQPIQKTMSNPIIETLPTVETLPNEPPLDYTDTGIISKLNYYYEIFNNLYNYRLGSDDNRNDPTKLGDYIKTSRIDGEYVYTLNISKSNLINIHKLSFNKETYLILINFYEYIGVLIEKQPDKFTYLSKIRSVLYKLFEGYNELIPTYETMKKEPSDVTSSDIDDYIISYTNWFEMLHTLLGFISNYTSHLRGIERNKGLVGDDVPPSKPWWKVWSGGRTKKHRISNKHKNTSLRKHEK